MRIPMPHWWLDCNGCGLSHESHFNILGQEYVVEVPWCQQTFNRSVGRETVWLVEEASGYTILGQKEIEELHVNRVGRNASDRQGRITAFFYPAEPYAPDIAPVWQSGTTANGRRYYLLRDLVRYIRNKRLRPVCAYCGAKIRRPLRGQASLAVTDDSRVSPHDAFESKVLVRVYRLDPDEAIWGPAIYCTRECRQNRLLVVLEALEARLEQARQRREQRQHLRGMKRQVAALRRFAQTGDKSVFDRLPEGYGPDRSTPERR